MRDYEDNDEYYGVK